MTSENKKEQVSESNEPKPKKKKVRVSVEEFNAFKEKEKLAQEYYDRLLRLKAEFENYRKRIAREREEFVKFANEELIAQILPVVDNLERALDGARNNHRTGSIKGGVELIQQQLFQILKKFGVERIESIGKQFDPHQHEVMMQIESEGYPEGTVVEEFQKGYTLNRRLIRPAVVKVAASKKKPPEPQDIPAENTGDKNKREGDINQDVQEAREHTKKK